MLRPAQFQSRLVLRKLHRSGPEMMQFLGKCLCRGRAIQSQRVAFPQFQETPAFTYSLFFETSIPICGLPRVLIGDLRLAISPLDEMRSESVR